MRPQAAERSSNAGDKKPSCSSARGPRRWMSPDGSAWIGAPSAAGGLSMIRRDCQVWRPGRPRKLWDGALKQFSRLGSQAVLAHHGGPRAPKAAASLTSGLKAGRNFTGTPSMLTHSCSSAYPCARS